MRFALLILAAAAAVARDSDGDGIDNKVERELMRRFAPRFLLSAGECDGMPAELRRAAAEPEVLAKNGTIYAQVLPAAGDIEIHYYHVWANDCGRMGHPWDVEHVSVRIRDGKALYWLAAAHQDTVCDNANAAKAASLDAGDSGATVWISRGKHGSFLNESICRRGCGGDSCTAMTEMPVAKLINIGEWDRPAKDTPWIRSAALQLEKKMRPEFTPELMAALDKGGVQAVYPIKIPGQAAILGLNAAVDGLGVADRKTNRALGTAEQKTRNALGRAKRWILDKTK